VGQRHAQCLRRLPRIEGTFLAVQRGGDDTGPGETVLAEGDTLLLQGSWAALDSNLDGFVEPAEFKGPLLAMRAKFADFDLNHDGKLDGTELAKAMPSRRMARGKGEVPDL